MKKYEKYKDSGFEWLHEMPAHWNAYKLKYLGFLYSGLSGKKGDDFYDDESPLSRKYINFKNIANNLIIDTNEFDLVKINEGEIQNQVKKGDLFFLMSSENYEDIAKSAILESEMNDTYLNSFCRGFRITREGVNPNFINYALSGSIYRQAMSNQAKGFTRINIQVGKIENFSIFLPTEEEQSAIASFLDHKTSQIDTLIEKKEQLIEKLKLQRQAIINEAVTKGLNPDAPMKGSGIEWLGEIPEHWEVVKMKNITDFILDGTHGSFPRVDKGYRLKEFTFYK